MLTIHKINNNITYRSNMPYEYKVNSFGNNADAKKAYLDMNKDVYLDFVDGDVSLLRFLAGKLKNYWNIITNKDPMLELKAKIIEENLKTKAKRELGYNAIA